MRKRCAIKLQVHGEITNETAVYPEREWIDLTESALQVWTGRGNENARSHTHNLWEQELNDTGGEKCFNTR